VILLRWLRLAGHVDKTVLWLENNINQATDGRIIFKWSLGSEDDLLAVRLPFGGGTNVIL
jgi:hypothetical protein